MKVKKIVFLMLMLSCLCLAGGPGTSAAAFLYKEVSADCVGRGGIAAAVPMANSEAVFWTPTGLLGIENFHFSFTHLAGLAFTGYSQISGAYCHPEIGTFGMGILYSGMYQSGYAADGTPNPSFPLYNLATVVSYARNLDFDFVKYEQLKKLAVGTSLKFIHERIDRYTASAFAMDIGAKYSLPAFSIGKLKISGLDCGVSLQNIGPSMRFRKEGAADPMPTIFRIGLAHTYIWKENTQAAISGLDLVFSRQYAASLRVGGEYYYMRFKNLTLIGRLGLNTAYFDKGWFSMFSYGIGIVSDYLKLGVAQIDYSLLPQGDLGVTHNLAVSFRF